MFTLSTIYKRISVGTLLLILFFGALSFAQPASAQWDRSTDVSSETLRSYVEVLLARVAAMRTQLDTMRGEDPDSTVSPDTSGQTSLVTTSSLAAAAPGDSCVDSSIWSNNNGPDLTRLTDFSRAGYMAGEEPIPNDAPQYNIKTDFGAVGDGVTNDTRAFERAVAQASGVIYIPPGEYKLIRPIRIKNDGVVLRGAGVNETILKFSRSLTQFCNNRPTDPTCVDEFESINNGRYFSHDKGFIQFGDDTSGKLKGDVKNVNITQNANRGDTQIVVANTRNFTAGQWILIEMTGDPNASISLHQRLQGGNAAGVTNSAIETEKARFVNKIVSKEGNTLTLALPLNIDVRKAWSPTVSVLETTVSNVGIEKLKIVFPFTEYDGHFEEEGYNAIHFSSVTNCWASEVSIFNADNGINLSRTAFCTLDRVKFNDSIVHEEDKDTARGLIESIKAKWKGQVPSTWYDKKVIRGEYSGHHGINLGGSYHVLITGNKFFNRFVHDISATSYSNQNVISGVEGFDLTLDHHRRAPHNNLYTNIDAGLGTHVWQSSGVCRSNSDCFGPHSGAYNTYWNIYRSDHSGDAVPLPINNFDNKPDGQDFGLRLNFVFNVNSTQQDVKSRWNWQVDDKTNICNPNLYDAMVNYYGRTRGSEPASIF